MLTRDCSLYLGSLSFYYLEISKLGITHCDVKTNVKVFTALGLLHSANALTEVCFSWMLNALTEGVQK